MGVLAPSRTGTSAWARAMVGVGVCTLSGPECSIVDDPNDDSDDDEPGGSPWASAKFGLETLPSQAYEPLFLFKSAAVAEAAAVDSETRTVRCCPPKEDIPWWNSDDNVSSVSMAVWPLALLRRKEEEFLAISLSCTRDASMSSEKANE